MTKVIRFGDGISVKLSIDASTSNVLSEIWYDSGGLIHRDNGLPAIINTHGFESHYKKDRLCGWENINKRDQNGVPTKE